MANQNIQKLVSDAVIELIYGHTMIATIAMGCGGVSVISDEKIPAMAYTDGKGIYINEHYIKNVYEKYESPLTMKNYMFLIAHEVLHLMTLTIDRQKERNPEAWNQATDYAINSMLKNNYTNNRYNPVGDMPIGGLYDVKYKDWSADQIYDELMKNTVTIGISGQGQDNNKNGDGSGQDQDQDNQKGNYNLDIHVTIDQSTAESIILRTDEALRQYSKDGSSIIDRIIKMRPQPKFPWRKMLEKYIKGFIKNNASWKQPSYRGIAQGLYLPKQWKTPCLNVAVGIDTSGSIDEEDLNKFFSHLTKIMNSFKEYNLELHCFSTEVHKETIVKLNKQKKYSYNIFKDYKIKSYGGTEIKSSFDYIAKHKDKFDVYICMTDGCDDINNLSFDKTNVIWAIIGDKEHTFKSPEKVRKAATIFIED